jgi:hypothetical protein
VQTVPLDDDFVKSSGFIVRLEIGKTWRFKLKSRSATTTSVYTTLGNGTYDPDHDSGTNNNVSYNGDFTFTLPYLTSTASVSLISSPLGFNVNIAGDAWKDVSDSQNNVHEYEVIYSNSSNPSFSDYSDTFHLYTENTTIPISSNVPAQWYVKVRPLQNKQPVGSGLYTNVVGGGGGIPAGDQIVMTTHCDIVVSSGTIDTVENNQNQNPFTNSFENTVTLGNIYESGLGLPADFGTNTLQNQSITITPTSDPEVTPIIIGAKIRGNICLQPPPTV